MQITTNKFKVLRDNNEILNFQAINIDFDSLAIIGPSGSGKSTFIECLSGQLGYEGSLEINQTEVGSEIFQNNLQKKIGFVFQKNNLFPNLTVLENLTLPITENLNVNLLEAKAIALANLELLGVDKLVSKKPHQISGGQEQRIAIARALSLNSELLILDEPTSALDPVLTKEVLSSLLRVKQKKSIPLIVVTHNIDFGKAISEKFLFIQDGSNPIVGDSKTITKENDIFKDFILDL